MKTLGQGVDFIQSYRQKHRDDVSVTFKHGGLQDKKLALLCLNFLDKSNKSQLLFIVNASFRKTKIW